MKRFFLLLVISLAIKVTPTLANGSSLPNASIIKTFNKEFLLQGLAWRCEAGAACIAKAANGE